MIQFGAKVWFSKFYISRIKMPTSKCTPQTLANDTDYFDVFSYLDDNI